LVRNIWVAWVSEDDCWAASGSGWYWWKMKCKVGGSVVKIYVECIKVKMTAARGVLLSTEECKICGSGWKCR